jgi:hypothetical protein
MTILARARTACAALIAGAAILATAASYGQDNPGKLAEQFGTATDAKAMLSKTVSALKADKATQTVRRSAKFFSPYWTTAYFILTHRAGRSQNIPLEPTKKRGSRIFHRLRDVPTADA